MRRDLTPASRPEPEPKQALIGWKASEVSEDELVDDEYIRNDPSSWEVRGDGDGNPVVVE